MSDLSRFVHHLNCASEHKHDKSVPGLEDENNVDSRCDCMDRDERISANIVDEGGAGAVGTNTYSDARDSTTDDTVD